MTVLDRRRPLATTALDALESRLTRCADAALDIAHPADAEADARAVLQQTQRLAVEAVRLAGWWRRLVVLDLVAAGRTHGEIGRALGVTRQRISAIAAGTRSASAPASVLPDVTAPAVRARSHPVTWAQEALLDASFETCAHGLALLDTTGRFVRVNSALGALLGRSPDELVGLGYWEHVAPAATAATLGDHVRLMAAVDDDIARRTTWVRPGGELVELELRVRAVRSHGDRRSQGFVGEIWPVSTDNGDEAQRS